VPDVWGDPLLRLIPEPARQQTRARQLPSGGGLGGSWRAVVVLLPRRCVRRVL